MRGSEAIEFVVDVLPRRWLRSVGPVVLVALLLAGVFDDVARWFVQDYAAGLTETLLPLLEHSIEEAAQPLTK
ncbi:MAG: hypothetical protein ABR593_12065 [Candidatus Limnocylindria bacterium]